MQRFFICAAAALAVACQGKVDKIPCTSDASCPTGSFCSSGQCVVLPSDHAVSIEAASAVTAGKTLKLTAKTNGKVSWTVQESGGGTVDADGTYHAPDAAGTYHVKATSQADATKSATAEIRVAPAPVKPALNLPPAVTAGKTGIAASIESPQAGMRFAWTLEGAAITSGAGTASITFTPGASGQVKATVVATNDANDSSEAVSKTAAIVAAPNATITAPAFVSGGKPGATASVPAQPNVTYLWQITGGTITSGAATSVIVFTPDVGAAVSLTARVTNSAGDFAEDDATSVTVSAPLTPDLAGPLAVRAGQPSTAQVVAPQGGGITYEWSISNGAFVGGGTSATGTSVAYIAGAAGPMTLTCVARNQAGDLATNALNVAAVGAAVGNNSTLTLDRSSLVADGTATVTATLQLRDVNNAGVPGESVTFSVTGTGVVASSPATANTDSTGKLTFVFAATKAEEKTVTASFAGTQLDKLVRFDPGAPSQARSSIAGPSSNVVADGVAGAGISVTVRDANDNAVSGVAVSFSSTGTSNSFAPSSGSSTAAGGVSTSLTSTKAESKTVSALVGPTGSQFSLTTSATFVAGDPAAAQTALAASASTTANGSSTSTVTLTVRDAFDNPVKSLSGITIAVGGTSNTIVPAPVAGSVQATTDATGAFSFTIASIKAEDKSLTATIPRAIAGTPIQKTGSATFVAGAPDSGQSTFVSTAGSVVADGVAAATLTATVKDAFGNLVGGQAVSVVLTSGSGTFSASAGNTGAAGASLGVFTTTLKSTVADDKSVTLRVGPSASPLFQLPLAQPIPFVPGDPDGVASTMVAGANPVVADDVATVSFTLTVKDAQGNLVKNLAGISITSSGSNNTFNPAASNGTLSASTGGGGTFTFTLRTKTAETKTLTASVPRATAGTPVNVQGTASFSAGAAVQGQSSISSDVNKVQADGVSKATFTVTLRDQYANPVPSIRVAFSASGSSNTLSTTVVNTTASGVGLGTATTQLSSPFAEDKRVTAQIGPAGSPVFSLQSAFVTFEAADPDAGQTTIAATAGVVANNTDLSTVTVTVKDLGGNVVKGLAGVSIAVGGTGNTLAGVTPGVVVNGGTATGTTDNAGQLSITARTSVAGQKSLTVTMPRAIAGTPTQKSGSVTFVPGPPAASQSAIAVSTRSLTAGLNTASVTVTLRDALGNLVPGVAVSVTSDGSGNSFTPSAGNSSAAGEFVTAFGSTRAEDKHLSASVGSPELFTLTLSGVVTVSPDDPDGTQSTLTRSADNVTADDTTVDVTLAAKDAYGNPVKNLAGVAIGSDGTSNTFAAVTAGSTVTATGISGATDAGGQLVLRMSSRRAESKNINATMPRPRQGGASGKSTTVTFVPGAPSQSRSSVTFSPDTVVANGSAVTTVTTAIRDQYDNGVPNVAVRVSASGTDNTFSAASGNTGDGSGGTTNGLFTVTLKSTVAEDKTVSASVGGTVATPLFTLASQPVHFVPGDADGTTSSIGLSATSAAADNGATVTATVVARDAQGNKIKGRGGVTITFGGTGNTITPVTSGATVTGSTVTGTTDDNGELKASIKSTKAEDKSVSASIPRPVAGTPLALGPSTVTFTPGLPAGDGHTTIAASKGTVTADGNDFVEFTVTLRDQFDNLALPPASITAATNDSGVTETVTVGPVVASVVKVTVKSTKANASKQTTVTIAPALGGTTFGVSSTVAFVAGPAHASKSFITPATASATTDTPNNGINFTARFRDAFDNPLAGKTVTLSASGSSNVFSPTGGNTNDQGELAFRLSSTFAETKTVTAAITSPSAFSVTASAAFAAGVPSAATTSFSVSPGPAAIVRADGNESFTMTMTVRDANSNPVPNAVVTFGSSASRTYPMPASVTTNASGQASSSVIAYVAGTTQLSGSLGQIVQSTSATFSSALWTFVPVRDGGNAGPIAVPGSGTILLGTRAGIYRTTTYGSSWTQVTSGVETAAVRGLASQGGLSGKSYALTSTGLWKSSDAGATWSWVSNGPDGPVAVDPSKSNVVLAGLYRSEDSGLTWKRIEGVDETPAHFAFDQSPDIVWLSTGSGALFKSEDNGVSFKPATSTCSGTVPLIDVDRGVTPSIVYVLCANGSQALRYSKTGGADWQTDGTFPAVGASLRAVQGSGGKLYVGSNVGTIHKTADLGKTWSQIAGFNGSSAAVAHAAADPSDGNRYYFSTGNYRADAPGFLGLNSDAALGGSTGIKRAPYIAVDAEQAGANHRMLVLGTSVIRLQNQGNSIDSTNGLPGGAEAIAMDSSGNGYAYVPSLSTMYRLSSGSTSWQAQNPVPPISIAAVNAMAADKGGIGSVWVSGTGGTWRGSGGGGGGGGGGAMNWVQVGNAPGGIRQVVVQGAVYALAGNTVYKANDADSPTWTAIVPRPAAPQEVPTGIAFGSGTLYVALGDGTMLRSNDQGTSFTPTFGPGPALQPGAFAVSPGNGQMVVANTGSATFFTTDGGATWKYGGSGVLGSPLFSTPLIAFGGSSGGGYWVYQVSNVGLHRTQSGNF